MTRTFLGLLAFALHINSAFATGTGNIGTATIGVHVVEFRWCSSSSYYVCALVYDDNVPREMSLVPSPSASSDLNDQISSVIGPHGRSMAMNVRGRVLKVHGFGHDYEQFEIEGIQKNTGSGSAPR